MASAHRPNPTFENLYRILASGRDLGHSIKQIVTAYGEPAAQMLLSPIKSWQRLSPEAEQGER
jgi:hypothetical protein